MIDELKVHEYIANRKKVSEIDNRQKNILYPDEQSESDSEFENYFENKLKEIYIRASANYENNKKSRRREIEELKERVKSLENKDTHSLKQKNRELKQENQKLRDEINFRDLKAKYKKMQALLKSKVKLFDEIMDYLDKNAAKFTKRIIEQKYMKNIRPWIKRDGGRTIEELESNILKFEQVFPKVREAEVSLLPPLEFLLNFYVNKNMTHLLVLGSDHFEEVFDLVPLDNDQFEDGAYNKYKRQLENTQAWLEDNKKKTTEQMWRMTQEMDIVGNIILFSKKVKRLTRNALNDLQ